MPWTKDEEEWLIKNYPLLGKLACAAHLNKSPCSIRMKTYRLGLRQDRDSSFFLDWQQRAAKSKIGKKRPDQAKVMLQLHAQGRMKMTDKGKEIISIKTKERLKETGHPKGFKNKKHSPQAKQRMSNATINAWANPDSVFNKDEFRQLLSDRASRAQSEGKLRNGYSRGSQGRRQDLGNIFFRSSWEANYARYLNFLLKNKVIYKWEFEPDTFWFESIKRGVRSYLPDFKIWETYDSIPYYVEVKGWMDAKSLTKLKRMKKYYPDVRVDLVDSKSYKALAKNLSKIIGNWE